MNLIKKLKEDIADLSKPFAGMFDSNEIECDTCNDEGYIEDMGDGDGFEYDVIGVKPCPECNDN